MQTTQRHRGAYGDVDSGEARKRRMLGREGFPKKIERERERELMGGNQKNKPEKKDQRDVKAETSCGQSRQVGF